MFRMLRPSESVEIPSEDVSLLLQTRRRLAYLQRLGIQSAGDADPPAAYEGLPAPAPTSADYTSQNEIRQKFLCKLAYSNVWVPQAHRKPKHQTVVIFDWDDTLLCTSFLREHDCQCEADEETLRGIVEHAKDLLEMAIKAGSTYIITNAMSGWVEYSAARWAPELLPTLRKVRVISARDKFEAAFPEDVGQWKVEAFLEVQRQLAATPITNLVVLGDADYEMEAARIMGDEFEEGLVKTVKFRPNPNLEEHLMQMKLVAKNLERIIGSVRKLQVNLTRK